MVVKYKDNHLVDKIFFKKRIFEGQLRISHIDLVNGPRYQTKAILIS